jgi:catechol 2,3-dioxygenase-like lactoylglutathione lyase family enzyme
LTDKWREHTVAAVSVRYIVDDVAAAVDFYTSHLGFDVDLHPAPGFAMLSRDDLRLLLNAPGAGGGGQGQGGVEPTPGGWNRFQLEVDDLDSMVAKLRAASVPVRTGPVEGSGGRQAVIDDPAGNPVELFQPSRG